MKTAFARATGKDPQTIKSYLATLPPDVQHTINTAKRKDNPALEPHITAIRTFAPSNTKTHRKGKRPYTRRSLGNPAKPPRAGAPNLNGTFQIDQLIAVRDFAAQQGGLDNLQHNLDALRTIQNA